MTFATALPMLRLALSALDREAPNTELARGILREIVGAVPEEPQAPKASTRAVTYSEAAKILSFSPKHVRHLAKVGRVPIIGSGRSARVLIDEAIAALRAKSDDATTTDAIENAGAAFARRGRLRAV